MSLLRAGLLAPVLCVLLGCSSSGSSDDTTVARSNTASGGDEDAGAAESYEGLSRTTLAERAMDGDPDPFTEAVRDEIRANFEDWELGYLLRIYWRVGDRLLDDPIFYRLLQALNDVAQTTSDPFAQALLACDDQAAADNREQVHVSCNDWEDIKPMLPNGIDDDLALAIAISYVGRSVAEAENSTVQESINKFITCNEPGYWVDYTQILLFDPCFKDNACVQATTRLGDLCDSPQAAKITYQNMCDFPIVVHYCLRTNEDWQCGVESLSAGLRGGEDAWVCESNGRVFVEAIAEEDWMTECTFKDPGSEVQ
jgi:hypothetical protein